MLTSEWHSSDACGDNYADQSALSINLLIRYFWRIAGTMFTLITRVFIMLRLVIASLQQI